MPLFETIKHTYKHLWSDISTASWRKYPSPERPDVLSVDMLSKEFDPETGVLKCTRLIICKSNTPSWLKSIFGNGECFFYEESTVDPKNKIMTLRTKNLNFTNILGVDEVCTYTPHPENGEWTLFTQEATVSSQIFGVARKVEAFCLDRFVSNAGKGRKIMEDSIIKVKKEAEESIATIDKTFTNIKHETELSLNKIIKEAEESLDKVLPIVKLDESKNINNSGQLQNNNNNTSNSKK